MADEQLNPNNGAPPPRRPRDSEPSCGLVMPISATTNHPESHWKDVLILLHRAIKSAGFSPQNVWESTNNDRISERIVGNIFNLDIAVVDISDLNPNVMFELGLRLSSKKPTVVVAQKAQKIPFDIGDFEVIFYPSDLTILQMEDFFDKLEKALKQKFQQYSSGTYNPFLNKVIIDVATPQTREVEASELILSRLDDLQREISATRTRARRLSPVEERVARSLQRSTMFVDVPNDRASDFYEIALTIYDIDDIDEIGKSDTHTSYRLAMSSSDVSASKQKVLNIAEDFGGEEGIPF